MGEHEGFLLEQRAPGELAIEIRVDLLEEDNASQVKDAATALLGGHTGITRVVFDIRGVRECRLLARAELGELQAYLKHKVLRTAWLTGSSRMRGMALVVVHAANDPNANVFVTLEQARAWLEDTIRRTDPPTNRFPGAR